jgi:hypothetical protein
MELDFPNLNILAVGSLPTLLSIKNREEVLFEGKEPVLY